MLIPYDKAKIDGHYEALKQKIKEKPSKYSAVIISTSDDPASAVYVKNKVKQCENVGLKCVVKKALINKEDLAYAHLILSEYLYDLPATCKAIVQLPLNPALKEYEDFLLSSIRPFQDVDGFSQRLGDNLDMAPSDNHALPCTPAGILLMLKDYGIYSKKVKHQPYAGYNVVILGRSKIVGRPMAHLFINLGATVTICNSHTKNLIKTLKQADIIISAIGKAHFLNASMVKKNAVIIDVGINRLDNGKLAGDVLLDEEMKEKAKFVSPVPGGVGRYTVFAFLCNIYDFALMYRLIKI